MSTKSPTEKARAHRNKARVRPPHDERQIAAGRVSGQPAGPIPIEVTPNTRAEEIAALLPPGFEADGFELLEHPDKARTLRVFGKVRPTVCPSMAEQFVNELKNLASEPAPAPIAMRPKRLSLLADSIEETQQALYELEKSIQDLDEAVSFVTVQVPEENQSVGVGANGASPVQSPVLERLEEQRRYLHRLASRVRSLTARVQA